MEYNKTKPYMTFSYKFVTDVTCVTCVINASTSWWFVIPVPIAAINYSLLELHRIENV